MGITAVGVGETWPYILPGDIDNPTIWKLKILDQLVASRLADELNKVWPSKEDLKKLGHIPEECLVASRRFCKFGIGGWENFKNKRGQEAEFQSETVTEFGRELQVVTEAAMAEIPIALLPLLAVGIMEGQTASDELKKKSESPGQPEKE